MRKNGSSLDSCEEGYNQQERDPLLKHLILFSNHTGRFILSIAVSHGWLLRQLDPSITFLHAHLHQIVVVV